MFCWQVLNKQDSFTKPPAATAAGANKTKESVLALISKNDTRTRIQKIASSRNKRSRDG